MPIHPVPQVRVELLNEVIDLGIEGDPYQVTGISAELLPSQTAINLSIETPNRLHGGVIVRHFVITPPAAAQLSDLLNEAVEKYLRPNAQD